MQMYTYMKLGCLLWYAVLNLNLQAHALDVLVFMHLLLIVFAQHAEHNICAA